MMKKKLLMCAMATLFVACSQDAGFSSADLENQTKNTFAANFIKKYGNVSPNQSWDLTSGATLGTRAAQQNISFTEIDGISYGKTWIEYNIWGKQLYVTKNYKFASAVRKLLPDGKTYTGDQAVLLAPGNEFTIYPICAQGAWKHDMYVKVGNKVQKIYSKTWTDYTFGYFNGMKTVDNKTVDMPGYKITAPAGTPIEIYLYVNGNETTAVGTGSGNAIIVEADENVLPAGVEIPKNAEVRYIGIEDNINGGDKDYNDLVLCIIGNPDVPKPMTITNGSYKVETNITKRYMIEDLGDADDTDFNDIVVDVTENTSTIHNVTLTNGQITADAEGTTTTNQKAVLRHLGGTLPFQLTIGNSNLGQMQGKMNVNPDTEFQITGWNSDTNNVSINVTQQSGATYSIAFPKIGAVPMIIAVKPTTEWMAERQAIPSDWWTKASATEVIEIESVEKETIIQEVVVENEEE